ncbi:hypothetical protein AB0F46_35365 [Streptomyces sp. NPDC026665]|uniref:hypothetical protein n=1 Tax=Streptomyces sp. NPDC026665 TaxID=3154798 RepID=UPI0033CFCC60
MVNTTASAAEWIGSGALGLAAALLIAVAAHCGAASAHSAADAEVAAYRAQRDAKTSASPGPGPVVEDFPPIPASPPDEALPVHDRTLQLHQVKENRARHRKEPACS